MLSLCKGLQARETKPDTPQAHAFQEPIVTHDCPCTGPSSPWFARLKLCGIVKACTSSVWACSSMLRLDRLAGAIQSEWHQRAKMLSQGCMYIHLLGAEQGLGRWL